MIPRDQWPSPEGERPPDWPEHYWDAFRFMELEGSSASDAAARIGRSHGTLSRFIRKQRDKYGAEFWPPTRRRGWGNPAAGTSVALARSSWPELRALASMNFGEAAETARATCVAALESLLHDPVRMKLLAPRDILDLAKAAEILARRADVLSGIVPMSNPLPPPGEPDDGYPVDLGPLGQVTPDGHRDVIEMASLVVRAYREENGSAKLAS